MTRWLTSNWLFACASVLCGGACERAATSDHGRAERDGSAWADGGDHGEMDAAVDAASDRDAEPFADAGSPDGSGAFDAEVSADASESRDASDSDADAGMSADDAGANEPCLDTDFVTSVSDASVYGPGQSAGRDHLPSVVCGPPLETGNAIYTASLGNGGSIIVGFAPRVIVDGPGVDFIVFENQTFPGFEELARVAVSEDGERWYEFPCDGTLQAAGSGLNYGTCAGWRATASVDRGKPFSLSSWKQPSKAGGDQFDLDDLMHFPGDSGTGLRKAARIKYVRITDVLEGSAQRVFDLDAVSIVHGEDE